MKFIKFNKKIIIVLLFIIILYFLMNQYSNTNNIYETFEPNYDPLWNTIDKTGTVDATDKITKIFIKGGNIYIPDGIYLIDGKGPDSGGILVNIKVNTKIICGNNVKFLSGDLDNDMIRFNCTKENINFEWYGGTFLQYRQKTSLVVPFSNNFKSKNTGVSQTSNGLSIFGNMYKINNCTIDGVTCYGADNTNKSDDLVHWDNSGGDSGIFVDGCKYLIVRNCKCLGNRDAGIYTSANTTGTYFPDYTTLIENNLLINCFFGITSKRSTSNLTIRNNNIINSVRGISNNILIGNGSKNVNIVNNKGTNCNVFIQIQSTDTFNIDNNIFTNLGSLLSDRKTIINAPNIACGIDVDNCKNGTIKSNQVNGIVRNILSSPLKNYVTLFRITQTTSDNKFISNTYSNGIKCILNKKDIISYIKINDISYIINNNYFDNIDINKDKCLILK